MDKRRVRLVHVCLLHSLFWNQHWNDVTAVFSIDAKVLVQGEDHTLGVLFRHPNQTGIGQGHGDIGIALDQIDEWPDFFFQVEDRLNDSPVHQFKDGVISSRKVPQQKTGLGQNRFTREERGAYSLPVLFCPIVEAVGSVKKCDKGACIHNDGRVHVPYRPKSSR